MKFQTPVLIDKCSFKIGYDTPIMFVGSCFADNIFRRMAALKFDCFSNPCGIVYNPISVADSLKCVVEHKDFCNNDIMFNGGLYFSLAHHGCFSDVDANAAIEKMNNSLHVGHDFLRRCSVIVITFGTSWIYTYRSNGRVAANCHKLPSSDFERRRLSIQEIVEQYEALISDIRLVNPEMKFIFTVSPIRHLKDGAHGNQLSKSVLLLAIDKLVSEIDDLYYFPSYELVMDELRDYRFYAEDMVHPSSQCVAYIWERFCEAVMSVDAIKIMSDVDSLNKKSEHRPINPDSKEWQEFSKRLEQEKCRVDALIDKIKNAVR